VRRIGTRVRACDARPPKEDVLNDAREMRAGSFGQGESGRET